MSIRGGRASGSDKKSGSGSSPRPREAEDETRLSWALTSRLTFIEEMVYWTGSVNRSDLIGRYSISEQQASGDLTRYQEMAPDNLVYDKSAKTYRAGDRFEPRFLPSDSDQVLSQLRLVAEGVSGAHPIIGVIPLGLVATPIRPVASETLRTVIGCIREGGAMSTHYVSFTQTDGRMRRLAPHALAFDGFRWHARARDLETNEFKDYVLGRMSRTSRIDATPGDPADDIDWRNWTQLVIAPNPALPPAHQKIIERDYGMREGTASIRVRTALVYYLKQRLGLDLKPGARPPEDQHIVLIEQRSAG
ncbi:MAG: WYL domain-containing protein [Alphaproteobacteria bacterium]|nr:WYL domain-containing protein [Alphaproteobacteria bacterium]